MTEKTNVLKFLLEEPSLPFRVVKRKGELRYIASNQRGSLKVLTQFAPPTKRRPKLLLGLLGAFDFRIPKAFGLIDPLSVSEVFLTQVAALLEIPVERIGIYVGEPDDQRKLVVTDIFSESNFVLKIAVGSAANEAIRLEAQGIGLAQKDRRWIGMVPDVRSIDPVCGRDAILIERIKGRQLTPSTFEQEFMKPSDMPVSEGVELGKWLTQNHQFKEPVLKELWEVCERVGALSICSPVGIVHGDFAPWNVIRVNESSVKTQVLSVKQVADLKPNHVKPKTVDGSSRRLVAIDWEFSRPDTPLIFDMAYAAWCFDDLLCRTVSSIDSKRWKQLVALGALWRELRNYPNA